MTSMTKRILFTGFEAFLGMPHNPSLDALRMVHLRNPALSDHMRIAALPVGYDVCARVLEQAIQQEALAALVCLGMHSGTAQRDPFTFYLEEYAYNRDDAPVADEQGLTRRGTAIMAERRLDEPLQGTLAWEIIERAWSEQPLKLARSQDPGRFICNHVYYCALHEALKYGDPFPVGFIHVPPCSRLRADAPPLVHVADGIECVVRALLAAGAGGGIAERMRV